MVQCNKQFDPEEVDAIRQACLNYVEGYFESDGERIKQGVHLELYKRNILENGELSANMTREMLIGYAVGGTREKPGIEVEIFDIGGDIASAVIVSTFVDYVHLAKLGGEWRVVNVLWR